MRTHFDVLLPFHENNNFLEQAFASVAASTGVNLNIILIDDRKDNSGDTPFISSRKHKIEIVKTPGGVGYGEALKIGSNYLASDNVAIMNSDDLIAPHKFLVQLQSLETCEISLAGIKRINVNNRDTFSIGGNQKFISYDPFFLSLGSYGANASWAMRRDWWKSHAFFDSSPALDWRIALKSFPKSNISYSSEDLYYYRKHGQQHTSIYRSEENYTELYLLWRNHVNYYLDEYFTENVFSIFATPWRKTPSINLDEIQQWLRSIDRFTDSLPRDLAAKIDYFVKRRILISLINSKTTIRNKLWLLNHSGNALLKVAQDISVTIHDTKL